MITAIRKPFAEIAAMLEGSRRVLVLGCGTCVTVCMAGGEKEVAILASTLRLADTKRDGRRRRSRGDHRAPVRPGVLRHRAREDRGGGGGAVARLRRRRAVRRRGVSRAAVLPGLDTKFYGTTLEQGVWAERCSGCGTCVIGDFGGVCPVDPVLEEPAERPVRRLANGKCEVDPARPSTAAGS